MESAGKLKYSSFQAAKRLPLLCLLILVGRIVVSCENPQPILPTIQYNEPYRPIPIASRGRAQVYQLVRFFKETNPRISIDYLTQLARVYIAEAEVEGINSDIAFCQMAHETNYLRFGDNVRPEQNNFCGLGATDNNEPGFSFPSIVIGVRAHIQHLKAYANARPLRKKRVDPRFDKVSRSQAPYVEYLAGTWASDPQYGVKLKRKLQALEKCM
jgi:hypothetical protein